MWRILVVDDEEDVRMVIKTTLNDQYEAVEATDGLDALEKIDRYEPDLVLMDVMMPLMDGFEACTAIRKNPRFHDLPVMFLSALGGKEDMKKGYTSGANLYLTKPFDPSRLLKNLEVFFERTPPAQKSKKYTIDQIRHAEEKGKIPQAPGSVEYDIHQVDTLDDDAAAEQIAAGPMTRIMVVDDEAEIVEIIKLSLDGLAEVVSAVDGMQAIERLVKYQPDMLIIDIMLPKMNGFQLCQSLRSNRAFARIPIMICSAKGADRDITFAKRVGANEYLVKPFAPGDLISKVKEMQKIQGFRVRPKTLTLEQINDLEGQVTKPDVFNASDDDRRSEGNTELENFLRKEGSKKPLSKDQPSEDPKKKRRFFGFGKD